MSEQQGLTERDYKILTAGFLPEEIGKNGKYDYIKRSAIHRRLRLVDRNWTNDVDTYVQVIGDTVTVWGSLTLKGVTRRNSVSKNLIAYASKENGGEHISEAEYARELVNTIKKATSALIFRCAEAFEIGLYMKEKRTPHTLASVLNEGKPEPPAGQQKVVQMPPPEQWWVHPESESVFLDNNLNDPLNEMVGPFDSEEAARIAITPKHWALNGDGEKIKARMNQLGLTWDDLKAALEPGKVLAKLSDTTLTYDQVYHKMDEIKTAKVADGLAASTNGTPMKVSGSELLVDDMVEMRGSSSPYRVMKILGDADNDRLIEIIIWQKTQFMTIKRLSFDKEMEYSIRRGAKLAEVPEAAQRQIDELKKSYEDSKKMHAESAGGA